MAIIKQTNDMKLRQTTLSKFYESSTLKNSTDNLKNRVIGAIVKRNINSSIIRDECATASRNTLYIHITATISVVTKGKI